MDEQKKKSSYTAYSGVHCRNYTEASAVRVGMYYFEYRQDSKILHYLKENESKSVFRGLVNDDESRISKKL